MQIVSAAFQMLSILFHRNFLNILQDETANRRKSIIPSAEVHEPPRERKEDPKPGMSNVKVKQNSDFHFSYSIILKFVNVCFWVCFFQIFFLILIGMICAIGLTVVGIWYYEKRKESSRKLW